MNTTGTTDSAQYNVTTGDDGAGRLVTLDVEKTMLAEKVNNLVTEAKQSKAALERGWKELREFYEGDQWDKKRPTWRANNVINASFANVETSVAIIMSMLPKLIARPANETAVDTADRVTSALSFLWKKLKIRKSMLLSLKDSQIYGTGAMKVTWSNEAGEDRWLDLVDEEGNPQLDDGGERAGKVVRLGEVCVRRVSPFHFHPDPLALSVEDAAYIVEAKEVDMDHIRKRYPEKAHLVTADTQGIPTLDRIWSNRAPIVDPSHDRGGAEGYSSSLPARSRVTLYEVWVRSLGLLYGPDEVVDYKALYEQYPGGRVITIAGSVILNDMPNPFDDGKFPYILLPDVVLPDSFWSKGEIEPIKPLQKELNKRSSQLIENAEFLGNPKVLLPKLSGLKKKEMSTKPGEVWRYHHPYRPEFLTPPPLPAYIPGMLDTTKRDVEWVSGVHDVVMGRRPTGITAAAAIAELQEAAQMRPRLKMEMLNDALREIGELILSRIRQFYTEEREFAVTREDGSGKVDFHKIYSEELQGHYDIDVDIGSSLPTSQSLIFQQAVTLCELNKIDGEALLEVIEWPKRDRILARMKKQEEEDHARQMEMMQAGGQPQGQQGPPPSENQGPPPPGEFSLRGGGTPEGPPPPPPDLHPEEASKMSQIMEKAAAGGAEQIPPELMQLLGGG